MPSWRTVGLTVLWVFAVVLTACGPTATPLDRVAPPARFDALRETAAWCPDFDASWWPKIDAAYGEYDRALDELITARWDPLSVEVSVEREQGRLPDAKRARAQWGRYQQLMNELTERERGLIVALDSALPAEADAFLALLRARLEFRRHSGMLCDPNTRLPGPLEVLASVGRGTADGLIVEAATAAYARLAIEAREVARARVELFIDYCEARSVGPKDATQLDKAFQGDFARALERFRLALLRESTLFAQALADEPRRDEFLSQLDATLHDGVRSTAALRATWLVGRRMLERREKAEPSDLVAFDLVYERVCARQAQLRPLLHSGSKAARASAYRELVAIAAPLHAHIDEKLGKGTAPRLDGKVDEVVAGLRTDAQVADALLVAEDAEEKPAAEAPPPPLFPGRNAGIQLLLGAPLREGTLLALAARVRVSAQSAPELAPMFLKARETLREATDAIGHDIETEIRDLGRSSDDAAHEAKVQRFMSFLRGKVERARALDRTANEQMLNEIARAAGVPIDDERVAIARTELQLLSEIGADRGIDEASGIAGLNAVSLVNPFEVVRSMGADEQQRAVSESIVFARADELLVAHREARALFERNVRSLLLALLRADLARRRNEATTEPPWRPALAGVAAADLRFQIAEDLRAAQGDFVARAYLTRLRELAEPEVQTRRAAAVMRLDRFAAGIGQGSIERAANEDLRTVLAEHLDQADERANAALNAWMRWRSRWLGGGARSDWIELERTGPTGWLWLSRVKDADERAIAACAASLAFDGAAQEAEEAVRATREFPLRLPLRLRPNFD